MTNYALLITYILSILLFLGTPRPVTVLVVSTSTKYGFFAGLKTVIGTNTASLILIAISFAIMEGLFSISEDALNWLTLLGSMYLIYFSIGIIKEKADIKKTIAENTNKVSKRHLRDGFIIGISNPKDILFFIAFFPLFLGVYEGNVSIAMVILTAVWVILDYLILTTYSFIFSKVNNNKTVNIINKTAGVMLLAVAIYALAKTGYEIMSRVPVV